MGKGENGKRAITELEKGVFTAIPLFHLPLSPFFLITQAAGPFGWSVAYQLIRQDLARREHYPREVRGAGGVNS